MTSVSFTVAASEMLSACKAAEAFRKGASALRGFQSYGLDADSLFFSSQGAGLTVEGFCWREAFALWLPSGKLSGSDSFSLPFASIFSFVKTTKGKGFLSFHEGKLSSSLSGGFLTMEAGPSLADSQAGESQSMMEESHSLLALLSADIESDRKGFPLAPFLTVIPFASDDAGRLVLNGAGFSGGAFFACDGFSMRKQSACLPGFPKAAGGRPEEAWLPTWVAACTKALTKPAEAESLLAFHWPKKKECQALRFWLPSGLCAAFRFAESSSFPNCQRLIPSAFPYAFTADRKAFLSMIESFLQSLKAYDGQPNVDLFFDQPIGTMEASVTLQRNVGGKRKPDMEEVGKQEASLNGRYAGFHHNPALDDDFFDLSASEQEAASAKFEHESKLCCNAFFLQKALKSFSGDRIILQWHDGRSPFTISDGSDDSVALIMPIQKIS